MEGLPRNLEPARETGFPAVPAASDPTGGRDFELGIPGFRFKDLYDVHRLPDLARVFDDYLREADPAAHRDLERYRRDDERLSPIEISGILVKVAPWVSRFIGRLFGIEQESAVQ